VTSRRLAPEDLDRIRPILRAHPFKPYRHYRTFSRKTQEAVLEADIAATLAHPDGAVHLVDRDGRQAAVAGRRLAWDTGFFGVPMARIDYVIGDASALCQHALASVLDEWRAAGVHHVSARADVADIAGVHVLEQAGFRLMDALVTYITRPGKDLPEHVREVGAIRFLRDGDAEPLVDIARDAYRGFRGRFHLDPHVPAGRADELYVEWARQVVTGHMAEMVLVSEGGDGRLVGFLAFRRREPVSSVSGVPVFGGGLGACRRDVPGAYAGLIRAGTVWAHEHGGVAETQTQNYNFSTVRIYEAVGAHYVRGEYTLHAWLG
jgi:hypothetical protein